MVLTAAFNHDQVDVATMNRSKRSVGFVSRQSRRRLRLSFACLFLLGVSSPSFSDNTGIADVPFEQLLQTEIITADKLARQISDAPSAVSIVTAEDIRTYGYRTLSDILDSMRGLTMAHDGEYGYLGGRGYGNAGNYAGRFTLLIDGYRATDNVFGQAYFGPDGQIDVEIIERVEYIPGSGSSSYGDSAFLGVINVVTKKGRDIGGTEIGTEFGSHAWRRSRVTFGQQFDTGLDLVVAASGMATDGRQLPEALVGSGLVNTEADRNRRFFAKAAWRGWTFETATAERWQTTSGGIGLETDTDKSSFGRLKYDGDVAANLKTSIDFYYGRYRYLGITSEQVPVYWAGGDWRGVDAKLVGTWFDGHTLVIGTEYRDDFSQWRHTFYPDTGYATDFTGSRQTTSLYVYDDIALTDKLNLNFGGRQDARRDFGSTFSPRSAIVWLPVEGTTLKLSTGVAHRQHTANNEIDGLPASGERVTTRELVWEQMLGRRTRLIGSLFQYRIDDFYSGEWAELSPGIWVPVLQTMRSNGAEVELEKLWENGIRLRSSYTWQDTRDRADLLPVNMAQRIAKFNLSAPILDEHLRVGVGIRYLGRRLNWLREYEPSATVGDLTLTGRWHNWSAIFSIRNVGKARYNEVSGFWASWQEVYPADRRNWWMQLGYDFK
jgi:iron complex outermembrane receptor protein